MELRPLVLALLETGPYYGYEIVRHAKRRAKVDWEEGTLYPLLHKMEQEDLLEAEWRKSPKGKDRKYYALTRKGRGVLSKARKNWRDQVKVVTSLLLGGSHGRASRASS